MSAVFPTSTASAPPKFTFVKIEKQGRVGIITLNRPDALNALNDTIIGDIANAILYFNDWSTDCGCIVITGAGRAFAAGADIKEMASLTYMDTYKHNMFCNFSEISKSRKPIIAAVNGFALGGGCELAMACDIIIAGENAVFGQPEIKLGTIPGAGGTQRLIRAVGKSKAMEMVLTGDFMKAHEAEKAGLVSRVVPDEQVLETALQTAGKIASYSKPIVMMAKECVSQAYESTLSEGLHFESRIFHSTFATADQKEGMKAFVNKSKPNFTDE